jgi:hypothetical protein
MAERMDLTATLVSLALAALVCAAAGWRGARPPDLQRGPRMVPYRVIMVAAAAAALLMLVHLANLAGVATGGR